VQLISFSAGAMIPKVTFWFKINRGEPYYW